MNERIAIVLFNLGGPDKLENVEPFLFNLFNDKAIISLPQPLRFLLAKFIAKRRVKKSQNIYKQIGNKSPILDITLSQALTLEKELSFFGDYKVFTIMRYAPPRAKEVMKEIFDFDPKQIILLPLYPQFSTTTTKSSIEEFADHFVIESQKRQQEIAVKILCCYPQNTDFIRSHAELIKNSLAKIHHHNLSELRFLFSAHGLPQSVIDKGDPYVFQVETTTNLVVEELRKILDVAADKIDFQICYQSKVGPMKWTSPSLDYEIRKAILDQKIPVIIPIAFVSEHSETLVELDIDFKNLAFELGAKNYLRVPALNSHDLFIKALSGLCQKLKNVENNFFCNGEEIRICPKKFTKCLNTNSCQA